MIFHSCGQIRLSKNVEETAEGWDFMNFTVRFAQAPVAQSF